ncbi:DNA-3-methyladenine glycosylase family protein [Paenibacillus lutimineralis]|uniref:DNA-3-methyladenine glycosylase II n=1 Tax=Paenibacillus lutimineralis TaxID=2707005 RepID=A0A3Q9I803_9BACL|nr:DNA-3-methyladenine glycosylase [Paenibacillus lutimineralis]AZS14558.1 DNA-3-methyladenine glycosylase 2 family protein [Paenibacillus lutimineralis]
MSSIAFHLHADDPRVNSLSAADPRMGTLISLIGEVRTNTQEPHFASIARSIISQQISVKAAASIRGRVIELAGELSPAALSAQSAEDLRAAGLSTAKVTYIRDLCDKVLSGDVDLERLQELNDEDATAKLVSIKGIGKWTAEMFLIFGLGRENVISIGDAGLQRAARWLHNMEERSDRKYLQQVAHMWEPYGSIASIYLWEAINTGHVDSGETLEERVSQSDRL